VIVSAILGWFSGDVFHIWIVSTGDFFGAFIIGMMLWSFVYPLILPNWDTRFLWPLMAVPGVLMFARVAMLGPPELFAVTFVIFSGIVLFFTILQIEFRRLDKLRRPKV
jgi:hypothetical protein